MDTTRSAAVTRGPRRGGHLRRLRVAARLALGLLALLCAAVAPAQAATVFAASFEVSATEASAGEAGVSRADRLIDLDASAIDADGAALDRPGASRASDGFVGGAALAGRPAGAPQERPPRASA